MKRTILLFAAPVTALLLSAAPATAQLYIRAPFVRVQVGGGVYVRAPFVNIAIPSAPRVYFMPPADNVPQGGQGLEELPRPTPVKPMPREGEPKKIAPPPLPKGEQADPAPVQGERVPTLEEFAKSFQPKAGNYEVMLLNPATGQPTSVRFTLPEGTPRKVNATRNEIEFNYGPRQYVKIRFDKEGAEVSSR